LAVPPTFALYHDERDYAITRGWEEAIDGCPDMAAERRAFLKGQIHQSTAVDWGDGFAVRPSGMR
jgi:hypothetical protein